MKAISLWQPWATLVALGEKEYETRSWFHSHRGQLAIHAAKRFTEDERLICTREPFRSALSRHGITIESLPFGAIVAIADLQFVYRTEDIASGLTSQERAFGNYKPGRYAWRLRVVHRFLKPIPVRGAQGLFEIDDDKIKRFA